MNDSISNGRYTRKAVESPGIGHLRGHGERAENNIYCGTVSKGHGAAAIPTDTLFIIRCTSVDNDAFLATTICRFKLHLLVDCGRR